MLTRKLVQLSPTRHDFGCSFRMQQDRVTWTRSGGREKFCAQFGRCTPARTHHVPRSPRRQLSSPACTGSPLRVTAHMPRTNGHLLYFKRGGSGKTSSKQHQTGNSNAYSPLLYSNTSCYKMHCFTLKLKRAFNHRAGNFMPLRLSNTQKQPCSGFLNTHTLLLSAARAP